MDSTDRETALAWEAEADMLRAGPVTQAAIDNADAQAASGLLPHERRPASAFLEPGRRLRPVQTGDRDDPFAPLAASGMRGCPHCLEQYERGQDVCPHCGRAPYHP